jgi:hypothetical protein
LVQQGWSQDKPKIEVRGKIFDEPVLVLLDTGNTAANLISPQLFALLRQKHRDKIIIKPYHQDVGLADGKTQVSIDHHLQLTLIHGNQECTLTEEFYVMSPAAKDVIICLFTLVGTLFDFFSAVLQSCHDDWLQQQDQVMEVHDAEQAVDVISSDTSPYIFQMDTTAYNEPKPGELIAPFSTSPGISEEEASLPTPSLFHVDIYQELYHPCIGAVSDHMAENIQKFEAIYTQQVSPDFIQWNPDKVRKLILQKGQKVFVSNNWNGIT